MGYKVGRHIGDLHIRLSQEEMDDLRRMGASRGAPLASIVRALIRDTLIKWRRDNNVTFQLGEVTFTRSGGEG